MKRSILTLGALALTLSLYAAPKAPAESAESDDTAELETLRSIGVANMATVADLCNVITLDRGDFAEFETADDRCAHLTELNVLNTSAIEDVYAVPVTYGTASKAAILTFELERSLMFRLTGLEWYAVQNAETLQIIPEYTKSSKTLSGEELLAMMGKAREMAEEKEYWEIERNVYEDFGHSTYQELEESYIEEKAGAADKAKGNNP